MVRNPRHPSTTGGQHSFATIPQANIPRSTLDRSHSIKSQLTESGYLYPIYCDEALPGDTIQLKLTAFARLTTLLEPIMDNLYLDFFFFAVPNRLLWENWEKFNGSQTDPGDSTDYVVPVIDSDTGGFDEDSLYDYLGIPPEVPDLEINALWCRAYNLIFNEWFRDQNLTDSVTINTDNGPDTKTDYELLKRTKRHDYFTSCLPWPQKGEAVDLPLGTYAPVISDEGIDGGLGYPNFDLGGAGGYQLQSESSGENAKWDDARGNELTAQWDTTTGLVTDLSSATAATITSLRQAFQMQKMLERDARGGTRYVEVLKSHFGVTSPDFRLQRPEFLGGGTINVVTHAVAQTYQSGMGSYVGNLGAYGTAVGQNGFTKSFTEHCTLIGVVASRADLSYQQGLERMWSRQTRYDYYWPSLAHLSEQAVLNKEIYTQGSDGGTDDDDVFGYQERYAEYRYKPSLITGAMRSTHSISLDYMHLAQEFSSLPVLGDTFIKEDPPTDRVVAYGAYLYLFDGWISAKHTRPMPVRSVPGLVDHF